MNRFVQHHRQSIQFGYSCFDRIIGSGMIQPLQCGSNVKHFFTERGQAVDHRFLVALSAEYHRWIEQEAATHGVDIVAVENGIRREELVQPYFERLAGRHGLAVILRCREPERIAVSYAKRGNYVDVVRRWIGLYYFYLQHPQCGRIFLRVSPYFPFNVRFWLNGHDWLANRLTAEGIAFRQADNAFTACADPARLQQLSDAFGPQDITAALEPLLQQYLPRLHQPDWPRALRHRWFMNQIEYCHNLVFHSGAALDRFFQRLLDHNRWLGQPDKIATIFRRRACPRTTESRVRISMLGTPVISTSLDSTSIKQYVRDGKLLRSEVSCYQLNDLHQAKHIDHLPKIRTLFAGSIERYHNAQQDVLETYVDRGQMERLRQPTVAASGRRTPGMRLDDPRLLAVLHALTAFVHLLGKACFRTKDLLDAVRKALAQPQYTLSQLRYDLGKLRGKGLIDRVPQTQTYRLTDPAYRLAVLYLKLYHRLYAPLTAAILEPYAPDNQILNSRRVKIDRLYAAVDRTLQKLAEHIGIAQPA
jgi:DNA-binding transcriptional ArsR family regulator